MTRCYYSADIDTFSAQSNNEILGELSRSNPFALDDTQKRAWIHQIDLLKSQLCCFPQGTILFEYTIPRVGARIDNVFITNGLVFLLEFKVGDSVYRNHAIEQVMDYALDLKNFHKESHSKIIVPILVATNYSNSSTDIRMSVYDDRFLIRS